MARGTDRDRPDEPVTVVTGVPRSGTSMMMRMLEAAGLAVLTDGVRLPDADNPNGYYELERVKGLATGDSEWVPDAEGRVVKVVSPLLPFLPEEQDYRLVVMVRDMEEVLASQRQMLENRDEPVRDMDAEILAEQYEESLRSAERWAETSSNVEAIFVDYNELLTDPTRSLTELQTLLGDDLDLDAMAGIVEPGLYRNRKP